MLIFLGIMESIRRYSRTDGAGNKQTVGKMIESLIHATTCSVCSFICNVSVYVYVFVCYLSRWYSETGQKGERHLRRVIGHGRGSGNRQIDLVARVTA